MTVKAKVRRKEVLREGVLQEKATKYGVIAEYEKLPTYYAAKKAAPLEKSKKGAQVIVGTPENNERRETALAEALIAEVAESGSDVETLCNSYGLKREELARLTGFSLRALAEWSAGKVPSQPAKRRLHEVRRLLDALSELVKRESIPEWLHRRNEAFDRLTPLQVIEFGEIDRLWRMVHELGAGSPE